MEQQQAFFYWLEILARHYPRPCLFHQHFLAIHLLPYSSDVLLLMLWPGSV